MPARPGPRAALAFALAFGTLATLHTPAAAFTDSEKDEIGTVVREYLLKHPEVLQEAIAELEKRQQAAESQGRQAALADMKDLIFNSPRGVVIGNPKGDVTLVEFFDYNCPYCHKAFADIEQLIKLDPNLRVVLREFPVLGPPSVEAAQVAVAVRLVAPEKYLAFHRILMSGRGQVNRAKALAAAREAGIDVALIEKQASSPELNATLDESMKIANALGLTGTPSFIVGNEVLVGALGFDAMQQAVKTARAPAKN